MINSSLCGKAFYVHPKRVIAVYLLYQKRIILIPKHNTGVAEVVSKMCFGEMYCGSVHNYPSFIKINPCRGIVDDYKVRNKIGAGGYLTPALLFVSSFFLTQS